MSSKKGKDEPKTPNDYFIDWCNGKITFDEALQQYGSHMYAAGLSEGIITSTNIV